MCKIGSCCCFMCVKCASVWQMETSVEPRILHRFKILQLHYALAITLVYILIYIHTYDAYTYIHTDDAYIRKLLYIHAAEQVRC